MLVLQGLTKTFGQQTVLHGVDLTVQPGEIMCLLGASGSGKTTVLRMIAGLEAPDSGGISWAGQSLAAVPAHERGFGLVFQDFALFPHLNVTDNVQFGLRMAHIPRHERLRRAAEVLELVGLSGFDTRDVTGLSGGEKQRVALARTLAPRPPLILFDEPLGSLDAALRERLVGDLRAILKRDGTTAVYVTHDQAEAFAVADRIAVMHSGRIEQIDTPLGLYHHPRTAFTAQFLGLHNLITPEQARLIGISVEARTQTVLLHPDGLTLTPTAVPGALPGVLTTLTFKGDRCRAAVVLDAQITLILYPRSRDFGALQPGDSVWLTVESAWVVALEDGSSFRNDSR
ncbi:MAG: ABC transporter ATP-binding protein [bacterium]|nr:ABC transporter ATP-binding protein [bacterium]